MAERNKYNASLTNALRETRMDGGNRRKEEPSLRLHPAAHKRPQLLIDAPPPQVRIKGHGTNEHAMVHNIRTRTSGQATAVGSS